MSATRNRFFAGAALLALTALFATGCGGAAAPTVTQATLDEVELKAQKLETENADLKKRYELLKAETGAQAQAQARPTEEAEANCAPPQGSMVRPNVTTTFNAKISTPKLGHCTFVDPEGSVIGSVRIGDEVYVGPNASIRGDEGQPIVIGSGTNVQDGVTLHALETSEKGKTIAKNLVTVNGKKYAIHVGRNVSLAHQALVHGPASIGDNTFVGMQAFVFKAQVGSRVVIEPGALVLGVKIASGRYVPAGKVVTDQAVADALPRITKDYPFKDLNDGVLHVNHQLAKGYAAVKGEASKPAAEGEAGAAA